MGLLTIFINGSELTYSYIIFVICSQNDVFCYIKLWFRKFWRSAACQGGKCHRFYEQMTIIYKLGALSFIQQNMKIQAALFGFASAKTLTNDVSLTGKISYIENCVNNIKLTLLK